MSSATVPTRKPPASSTAVRRNSPKAPEMISRLLKWLQPARPVKKARAYSRTWKRSSHFLGMRASVMRPASITGALRGRSAGDGAVLGHGGVEGPDGPPHPGQGLVLDQQPAGPQDGLAVEQRVGVHGREQRGGGQV